MMTTTSQQPPRQPRRQTHQPNQTNARHQTNESTQTNGTIGERTSEERYMRVHEKGKSPSREGFDPRDGLLPQRLLTS